MNPEADQRDDELFSRRELLKRSAVAGAVLTLPAFGTAHVGTAHAATTSSAAAGSGSVSVLTPPQSAILEAMVERLVPADANGPGGKEAGAARYIEQSLAGGLAGGLSKVAPLYTAGLPAVDAYANSAYGAPFTALPPDKQDAVISDLQSNKATGFTPDSFTFFSAVHEHTLEGMFADPVYGGNKNFAGWNLVGYPGVKMPVTARDQRVGVKVRPAHRSGYAFPGFSDARKAASQ
jgi:gluconate 2-dehydrogenase gamma chain